MIYVKAKPDTRFVLTPRGFEEGKVRNKFEEHSTNFGMYSYAVPKPWLDKGWVVEVKKEDL